MKTKNLVERNAEGSPFGFPRCNECGNIPLVPCIDKNTGDIRFTCPACGDEVDFHVNLGNCSDSEDSFNIYGLLACLTLDKMKGILSSLDESVGPLLKGYSLQLCPDLDIAKMEEPIQSACDEGYEFLDTVLEQIIDEGVKSNKLLLDKQGLTITSIYSMFCDVLWMLEYGLVKRDLDMIKRGMLFGRAALYEFLGQPNEYGPSDNVQEKPLSWA